MWPSEPLWVLAPDLILPTAAVMAVLAIERAGHVATIDATGKQVLVEPAPGVPLDPHDLAQLRRWKGHVLLFLRYQPAAIATGATR